MNNHVILMKNSYKYLAIPLVLLAFLPLLHQFSTDSPHQSVDELFAQHFNPQPLLDDLQYRSTRPKEGSVSLNTLKVQYKNQQSYQDGVAAYQAGNYSTAIEKFENYTPEGKERNYYLFLGISYLAKNRLDDAQNTFEAALKYVPDSKKGDAEWYLVLTLLRKNAMDQAKQRLERLIANAPSHPRYEQAIQLQQQIQRHYPS